MEVLAPLTFIVAIVGIWVTWWAPKATRIREALREADPSLYFRVGSYGGPGGYGFGINLQNQGNAAAYNLSIYLPDIQGPAWQDPQLPAGATLYLQIASEDNAPVRTQQMEGLEARLVYHDRFQRGFSALLPLVQHRRDDGFYNIGAGANESTILRPSMRFRDLWRLRKIV